MTAGTGRQRVVNDDIQLEKGSVIGNEQIHDNDDAIETEENDDLNVFPNNNQQTMPPRTKVISTKLSTIFEMPPQYLNESF